MSVLTLTGKAINWSKSPKATDRVKWSGKTSGGKAVTGSLRSIAWIDQTNARAVAKFGRGLVVIQSAYNSGVAASAGTHDYDACFDVYIPGVPWRTQETFFRQQGSGAYWRKPPKFGNHIHLFVLPPREGKVVSDDYKVAGFKVGKYVDGGYSLYGSKRNSSQIDDYYARPMKNALAGHAADDGYHPPNITATIFNLPAYITAQRAIQAAKVPAPKPTPKSATFRVATNNVMSLPKNPEVTKTILATPGASVLLLQEMDLPVFHNALRNLPGYSTGSVPASNIYSTFVAYRPGIWDHVSTKFVKAYDGAKGVSFTRHIAITVLRHKALGREFAFLSYHSVTAGNDAVRKRLRASGDAAVRKELTRLRAAGTPIILGADTNRTGNTFGSCNIHVAHKIDHEFIWNGRDVVFKKNSSHTVPTRSDHDVLVVDLTATVK